MKKAMKQKTLLKGEGINQHTLYGKFAMEDTETASLVFAEITVEEPSLLKHEQPNGNFAEHNTLKIDTGRYVMGRQVEYNPFDRSISQIWD